MQELRKIWAGVFDHRTLLSLLKLLNRGVLDEVVTTIKQGKESRVLGGHGKHGEVAIKVYATEASNFKRMWPYLHGDPRIGRIGKSKRALASAWCRREYANLLKASKAGIACPKPLGFEENVLVMEFIGKNFVPAPRLIDLEKDRNFIKKVVTEFKKIKKAGLVHGDFSAYNILVWRKKPVFIDWSHAVLLDHPLAKKLLERDMENLAKLMEL